MDYEELVRYAQEQMAEKERKRLAELAEWAKKNLGTELPND